MREGIQLALMSNTGCRYFSLQLFNYSYCFSSAYHYLPVYNLFRSHTLVSLVRYQPASTLELYWSLQLRLSLFTWPQFFIELVHPRGHSTGAKFVRYLQSLLNYVDRFRSDYRCFPGPSQQSNSFTHVPLHWRQLSDINQRYSAFKPLTIYIHLVIRFLNVVRLLFAFLICLLCAWVGFLTHLSSVWFLFTSNNDDSPTHGNFLFNSHHHRKD